VELADPSDDVARFSGLAVTSASGARYPLGELIGSGSQALVFAVPGAPLVIKVLRPSFVRGSPEISRLVVEKEHAALARTFGLGSPYLVRLADRGVLLHGPLTLPWLALGRVPRDPLGLTLGERVTTAVSTTGTGLAPARAMRLFGRLALGLGALHDAGLVHRDLKPSNVLVSGGLEDETPLIADFGVVRAAGMAPTFGAGFLLSTPGYGAPESAHPARVVPATDVFSFAALAFLALAGEPPFQGSDLVIWAYVQGGVLRPLAARERLHPTLRTSAELGPLQSLLKRALSPDPGHRPPSVQALWAELGGHLARVVRAEGQAPAPLSRAAPSARSTGLFEGRVLSRDDEDDT